MIAHRFRFVKNFFKFFQTFSFFHSPLNLSYLAPASQPTRLDYHTQSRLSTPFFKFSKLFQVSLSKPFWLSAFASGAGPCRTALAYISKTPRLCQHLFSPFSPFFSTSFSTTISTSFSVHPLPNLGLSRAVHATGTYIFRKSACGTTSIVVTF